MYTFKQSQRFRKSFKKVHKRKNLKKKTFLSILQYLQRGRALPARYKNHKLQGEFAGCMECHLQSDLLLIYAIDTKEKVIHLLRIGSHSDLF